MTVTVLMVAEKPMLADSIAKLLSDNRATKRKGWNGACSVSEYSGNFMRQNAKFKVTSTCGHVMSVDFKAQYNNWDKTDPKELYKADIQKNDANPKLKMNEYLASEAKGCNYLVLWLDCDKEGENICFEVIAAVQHAMKSSSGDFMQNVYRAHFSAITEKDIKAAMKNLGRPNRNEAMSVDARQELDLRVGCSFTRFQTRYFQDKYSDLDSNVISYGPCQTPTLGFCVSRHDEIITFKSEPYWVIQATFETSKSQPIKPQWDRGRMFDREVATVFLNRIKATGSGEVIKLETKNSRKERPCALNTVELMRIGSSALGMAPTSTMHVAESLYTQGYISYPRTETTAYPVNFDLVGTLQQQANDRKWGDTVRELLSEGIVRPKSGVDKGDHPPITPMRPSNGQLSGDSGRVYDYICQHFIATLMRPCLYETTTATIKCGEETFTAEGKRLVDPGFTKVFTWKEVEEEASIPQLSKGEILKIRDVILNQKSTTAPGYLTESELISLMEKHGIGTDASIPVHINTICTRNYVQVESGRRLIPTKLGIALVHGYKKVDPELVQPTMRAAVETQLNQIAKGLADFETVRDNAISMFYQKFLFYVANVPLVDSLFQASFTTIAAAGKPFSKCGKCNRYMKYIDVRPMRLYCPTCEETYDTPSSKAGFLRTFKEIFCPLDGFQLVYWQGEGGKLSRSFAFCPQCYNHPPFENMKEATGCDRCPHPTCPYSPASTGFGGCLRECGGTMVLDPKPGPKWRFCCNNCPSVVSLFEGASTVRVLSSICEQCLNKRIFVEFKEEAKSPLPDKQLKWKGCIFCDESVSEQVNLNHAYLSEEERMKKISGGRRGRGRGRGRGGRGRGRGGGPRDRDRDDDFPVRGGDRGGRGRGRGRGGRGGGRAH